MNTFKLPYQVGITTSFFYFTEVKDYLAEHQAELHLLPCRREDELSEILKDMDVILTISLPFTRKVLSSLPKCKGIVRIGIGIDNFDLDAATEHGIFIANVPDFYVEDVATLTITYILALAKKIFTVNEAVKSGQWHLESIIPCHRLSHSVVGLLGFGNISKAVLERLKPFGCQMLVHDPYVPDQVIHSEGGEPVSLEKLLSESDFLSIHCPLTRDTENLIDESALKRFKKGACIINTARGGIVDEKAVLQALQEGHIAGAAFDVFLHEPPESDNPLVCHPHVISSPHIGWYSEESRHEAVMKAATEVVRILSGKAPINLVNPAVITE